MNSYDRILVAAARLNEDERDVLAEVAEGLVHGQDIYGKMDLASDTRDFVLEATHEDRDWLVYRAMQIVAQRRGLR